MTSLDEVCKQIDEQIAQYASRLDAIREKKQKAAASIKEGLWAITKARSAAGPLSITQKQYNFNSPPGIVADIREEDSKAIVLKLTRPSEDDLDSSQTEEPSASPSARQRKAASNSSTSSDSESDSKSSSSPTSQPSPLMAGRDPTRWFGFSARSQLEVARTKFVSALFDLISSANDQLEVFHIEEQIEGLKTQKAALQKAANS